MSGIAPLELREPKLNVILQLGHCTKLCNCISYMKARKLKSLNIQNVVVLFDFVLFINHDKMIVYT